MNFSVKRNNIISCPPSAIVLAGTMTGSDLWTGISRYFRFSLSELRHMPCTILLRGSVSWVRNSLCSGIFIKILMAKSKKTTKNLRSVSCGGSVKLETSTGLKLCFLKKRNTPCTILLRNGAFLHRKKCLAVIVDCFVMAKNQKKSDRCTFSLRIFRFLKTFF